MSFTFAAVGTTAEIGAQLAAANIAGGDDRFNEVAFDLRDLLAKHFAAESAPAWGDAEYRYTVKAGGHGGGSSPLSLQVTVEPHYIARLAPADAVPDTAEG
jgi:hypothetical protein